MSTPPPFPGASGDVADLLGRIELPELPETPADPRDLLTLQDFVPVTQGIEWELARAHWMASGATPFVRGDVPYAATSSGWNPELVAHLIASIDRPRVRVLELGPGSGIFARQLLRAHARLWKSREGEQELELILCDFSASSVAEWQSRDVFESCEGTLRFAVGDALDPTSLRTPDGTPLDAKELDLVVANYLLDALPVTFLRHNEDAIEERVVRTLLTLDAAGLRKVADLSIEEAVTLAASEDEEARRRLVPLLPFLEYEAGWAPLSDPELPGIEALFEASGPHLPAPLSHGALSCIEAWLPRLREGGAFLAIDYGPARAEEFPRSCLTQRNGNTLATGINFPLIEQHFKKSGLRVLIPEENERTVHSRLILPGAAPALEERFLASFGHPEVDGFERFGLQAQEHADAGRYAQALEIYRRALRACPSDWHLLGRCAEFLDQRLQRGEEAVYLAREALAENPSHSAWLWNTLGNALSSLREHAQARAAYERALAIDPRDAQAHYNLSCAHSWYGEYEDALSFVASGLAHDTSGAFREFLLRQQDQLLRALAQRWTAEGQVLDRRDRNLRCDS